MQLSKSTIVSAQSFKTVVVLFGWSVRVERKQRIIIIGIIIRMISDDLVPCIQQD